MTARVGVPTPARRRPTPSFAERALLALGADPAFVHDVLGDLAEERVAREATNGSVRATTWYVVEATRALPHLAWNAARCGTPRTRMRLAAVMGAIMLAPAAALTYLAMRPGPPAALAIGNPDGITLNNIRPVRLTARVLDAKGRALDSGSVRFAWVSGARIPVTADGVVHCTHRGESVVRASVGGVARNVVLHCEPVRRLFTGPATFYAGDSARPLVIDAQGPDGAPVRRMAGVVRVEDSTVAQVTPDGMVRPLRAGATSVAIDIGDRSERAGLTVFERVPSFERLREDQGWVAAPVNLEPGDSITWPLPKGLFYLAFASDGTPRESLRMFGSKPLPPNSVSMMVRGPIVCMPDLAQRVANTHCLARGPGASITISHAGGSVRRRIAGVLALERQK